MVNNSVTEWTHIVRPGADDCHYRGYLVSGARLVQYVTDCIACMSSVREGTGGLVANVNADFLAEVHAMDELVIKLHLDKVGNTSRVYGFTITKTIEYANDGTSTATPLLDNPKLAVKGTVVLVCKPH